MSISSNGQHKGSRQENFWKRKEQMASEIENFRSENPTLFGSLSLPSYTGPAEVMLESESTLESPVHVSYADAPKPGYHFSEAYDQIKAESPNINQVLNLRTLSSGVEPVRDEKAEKQARKQAKLSALAQGLQSIFGAFTLGKGNDVPVISDGGIGADALAQMNQLDQDYFRRMAEHRDRQLKAELFNAGVINDAEMAQYRARQAELAGQKRAEQQDKDREDRQKFNAEQAEADRKLRRQGYSIDQQRINNYGSAQRLEAIKRYEAEYDDLAKEYQAALENFNEDKAKEIEAQMNENISVRRSLQSQLAEREGFNLPSNEPPAPKKKTAEDVEAIQETFRNPGKSTSSESTAKPSRKVDPKVAQGVTDLFNAFQNDKSKVISQERKKVLVDAVMDLGYNQEQAEKIVMKKAMDFGKRFASEDSRSGIDTLTNSFY